jgi:hypothetical protein
MKAIFKELLDTADVEGVLLVSFEGSVVFKAFSAAFPEQNVNGLIGPLITTMDKAREADVVFQRKRLYIRRTDNGFIMIFMGSFAPIAMVRLNCDMLLPQLSQGKKPKKRWGLFKKKN